MSSDDQKCDALKVYLGGCGIEAVQALCDPYEAQLARFRPGNPADWNIPFELFDDFQHLHELADALVQLELITPAARSAIEQLWTRFENMSDSEFAPGIPPHQLQDSPAWAEVRRLAREVLRELT